MAKTIAHWQYEEDDTVAILPKSGGVRIGLVNETFDDESSSDDDDSSDSNRLKPGQVRVEWYPTGKESAASVEKVILLDRALLMGETVCRRSHPDRVGTIRKVSIRGDFLILPQSQFIVRNITEDRIEFVNKYDDASSSCYVGFQNWAGSIKASSDRLLLNSEEGYQCWISTSDMSSDDLHDCCTKRFDSSSYNTRQWYKGEPVKCTSRSLEKAKWVPGRKPSDVVMRKWNYSDRKIKFTVVKVEPEFITVRWITAVGGPNASVHPPAATISGEGLQKVRKLDHFEHQLTQLGDRIWVDIGADDIIVPYSEWTTTMREELQCEKRLIQAPDFNRHSSLEAVSNAATAMSTLNSSEGCQTAVDCGQAPADPEPGDTEDHGDDLQSVSVDTESEAPRKSRSRLGVTARRWKGPAFASSTSPAYRKTSTTRRQRMKTGESKTAKTSAVQTAMSGIAPAVGDRVVGEAIYVRSFFEILWQDGELESDVPSCELAFASGDLDEHVFVPGNFVLQEDDKPWPEYGYGVVEKVDNVHRVATVNWYEHSPDTLDPDSKRTFIRKDQVSVYELVLHSDFDYSPGVLLMKVSHESTTMDDSLAPIGQVLFTDSNGELVVKWLDGTVGRILPEEACRVVGDYRLDDDEGDEYTESSSDEDSDSDSWSTVTMDSETQRADGGENDESDGVLEAEPKVKPGDAVDTLNKLSSSLDTLRGGLLSLRKCDCDVSIRQNLAAALTGLHSVLKRITKVWFGLDMSGHRYAADLTSCVRILKTWMKTIKEKDSSAGRNHGGSISHPAKDGGPTTDPISIDAQLDMELELLCHVNEEMKKFSEIPAGESSDSVGTPATTNEAGWMGLMRKTVRSFLMQIQNQTAGNWTNSGSRWQSGNSGLLPEEEERLAAIQRLLQRGLERRAENGANGQDAEADKEFLTASFRTMVNDCGYRCFESNPKHKHALAIVDFSSAVVLTVIRLIIEHLVQMERNGTTANSWETGAESGANEFSSSNTSGSRGEICSSGISSENDQKFTDLERDTTADQTPIVGSTLDAVEVDGVPENVEDLSKTKNEQNQETSENETIPATATSSASLAESFELLESVPSSHKYISSKFDSTSAPSRFVKAVSQEMKLLRSSLPPGVYVKGFENRMDLYSCMLVGPAGTPFADGLFFFDVQLKPSYPVDPPVFYFKSFSTDQLNPNLYQDGKVCVSLLGTWSGKDSEMWNVGSNLLQVLVSIQGLILNAEPYYNEAGYEVRRGHEEFLEKSRRYNELALIRTIESLWKQSLNPPAGFENDVRRHLAERGRKLIYAVQAWIGGTSCGFPLQPVSQGFALSAKKQLSKLAQALTSLGF